LQPPDSAGRVLRYARTRDGIIQQVEVVQRKWRAAYSSMVMSQRILKDCPISPFSVLFGDFFRDRENIESTYSYKNHKKSFSLFR
jgi:hypothetical protein